MHLDRRVCHGAAAGGMGGVQLRFCAGVPLIGTSTHRLGMLAIIDVNSRCITAEQRSILANMSGTTCAFC